MLRGLNHLTLAVFDLQRSVHFYRHLPGMRLHATWCHGAYLSCGELWLCLSEDKQRDARADGDYTHYAFSVSEQDYPAMLSYLHRAGVTFWKTNRSEGESCYFLDPDGHKLELHVGGLAQRLAACRRAPYQGMIFFD
ncbi:fosfomycin resistance glutathione transferase [Shimwellia pseudoproteus]|uniref:fosfomycin resistance glutathione transferase n=1 Tax=Shimwellia pseudoproteus TaxID=570012 RepID=UPI0018EB2C1D|nr:fosfomycin resistance glutathione transferase [Shimwellia pseudoproteus]MBJ3816772.1 fosfomycin resistance glutathione transferase [Shimwellia pseudoproteus]